MTSFSFSQNENKKWFFGNKAGLDFMTSPPTPILGSAMTFSLFNEGTASVADALGNLLFYTDGITIWNRAHQVMANGTGLNGGVSTTQAALIVKQPGNSNIYFVFTLAQFGTPGGLCYSTVDMNLSVGMGSVTVKNTLIKTPSTEKLHGTKHCNGIDTWVVSHDHNSNVFRSILVTAVGVSTTATLTPLGAMINTPARTLGSLKISPSGKKISCAIFDNAGSTFFELYDFDNSTGLLSNPLILNTPSPYAYNAEFSPDETKLYGSMDGGGDTLLQWNLCAGNIAAINNSRYIITSSLAEGMQLGPDGKIYVARLGKQTLGVINDPNLPGAACNYVDQGQTVAPNYSSLALCNFIQGIVRPPFSYAITPSISCGSATFTPPPPPTVTVTSCGNIGYSISSFEWFFGDPASGSANTSTLSNPVHTYPGQGSYVASLVYHYANSCGGMNTDTLKQEILVGVLPINSTSGYNTCSGQTLTLSVTGAQTYSWSTGASTSSITVSPTVSTTYTLFATDVNGCAYKSAQVITVFNYPVLSIRGNTLICPGFQAQLTATGAATYSWVNGPTTSVFSTIPASNTTYTVIGSLNGCTSQQTVSIKVGRPPIAISGNTAVCPGSSVNLSVTGNLYYTWSDGSSGTAAVFTPTANTVYTVQGLDSRGCSNTASVLITMQTQSASVNFNYASPVCEKSKALFVSQLSGFNEGGFYSSQDLDVDPVTGQIPVSAALAGTYVVNYFLAAKGCTASASNNATVIILPLPSLSLVPDIVVVPGVTTLLSPGSADSYTWSPADFLSCTHCESPVASTPYNMQYCVTAETNSCLGKACVNIAVSCESTNDYSLPNAFTPNGDGRNDAFCLQGWSACMLSFNIKIFNRWGEIVFESSDADFCWDGSRNGKPLNAEVFVYVLSAKRITDKSLISKKGNISLIR